MVAARLLIRTRTSAPIVAPARDGKCGCCRISRMFTQTATMTSPTRLADAPAAVAKNCPQASARCSGIPIPIRSVRRRGRWRVVDDLALRGELLNQVEIIRVRREDRIPDPARGQEYEHVEHELPPFGL